MRRFSSGRRFRAGSRCVLTPAICSPPAYDIRTPKAYATTMKQLDATIGCERVVAFHLNDSKMPLGSRVDRHENIGKRQVGLDGCRNVLRDVPMVLETPKSDDLHEDVENLRVLRSLTN